MTLYHCRQPPPMGFPAHPVRNHTTILPTPTQPPKRCPACPLVKLFGDRRGPAVAVSLTVPPPRGYSGL